MTPTATFLKDVEERLARAIKGPWHIERVDHDEQITFEIRGSEGFFAKLYESDFEEYKRNAKPTCEFIAHARTDIERLLKICKLQDEALAWYASEHKFSDAEKRTEYVQFALYERARQARETADKIAKGEM